jgi:radical SAM protein with 4Fe4S-binding SPASM domain
MTSEIKPIYGTERIKLANAVPLQAPLSMFVFPSTYCNFKCVYCAHSFSPDVLREKYDLSRENMSLETYRIVVEQVAAFPQRIKLLSLTGQGEPLLNKNIATMVGIAKEAAIAERIEIISNGQLLTREMSDSLITAGLDTLRISLQGLSSEKYRSIGGVNIDYDKLVDNVRYFYNNKQATDLFVKVINVALDDGEDDRFFEQFRDCSDRMYIEKMLPAYAGVPVTQGMQVTYDRYGREIKHRDVCPLPFYMLGVFPNGDVEPCDTIYKPIILGNVHTARLRDMWRGEKLRDFWSLHLRGQRYANAKCASCNAPDDVSHPEDVLDAEALGILRRLG